MGIQDRADRMGPTVRARSAPLLSISRSDVFLQMMQIKDEYNFYCLR